MAILKVAQMGHPILRRVADPIDRSAIGSPELAAIVRDMLETLDEYDGAGLAAPQVHLSIRLVALTLTPERGTEFWVNPVITVLSDTTSRSYEGCLSVADLRGAVERPNHIRVDFVDLEGIDRSYELRGFPAVVAQHECDHLDGVLYVDRVEPLTLAFLPEYRRYGPMDHYLLEVDDPGATLELDLSDEELEDLADDDDITEDVVLELEV